MEKAKTSFQEVVKIQNAEKIFTFITPNLLILAKEKHSPSFTADFYDFLAKVIWPRDLPTGGGNFPTRISKRNTCSNDSAGPRKGAMWETRKQPYLAVSKNRGVYPPKWMVNFFGKPYEQMDDLGVPLFLETPI